MPLSRVYNNQTLAEQESRRRLGTTFEPEKFNADSEDYAAPVVDERGAVDEMLAGAKGALGRADILSRQINNQQRIGAGAPETMWQRLKRMASGAASSLARQPLAQAMTTPVGQTIAGEMAGPVLALRGLGRLNPEILSRLRPEGPLPYKPPMPYKFNDPSSLIGLKTARPANLETASALESLAESEVPSIRSVLFGGAAGENLRMARPSARTPLRVSR